LTETSFLTRISWRSLRPQPNLIALKIQSDVDHFAFLRAQKEKTTLAADYADLRRFGCRGFLGFVSFAGSPFQVPRDPRVLRQCLLTEQARSQPLTSHTLKNGFAPMRKGHRTTQQRIRIRISLLINIQTVKVLQFANPSRHPSPRWALRRKHVFRAETAAGRPASGRRTRQRA
jgi:hypothetical protein